MTSEFFTGVLTSRRKVGGQKRKRFAIVQYDFGNRQAYLVIPSECGIKPGDRITYHKANGGISFRVEENGTYSVFRSSKAASTMRTTLCPELAEYAIFKSKDIICKKVDGGWFVPFSQFE